MCLICGIRDLEIENGQSQSEDEEDVNPDPSLLHYSQKLGDGYLLLFPRLVYLDIALSGFITVFHLSQPPSEISQDGMSVGDQYQNVCQKTHNRCGEGYAGGEVIVLGIHGGSGRNVLGIRLCAGGSGNLDPSAR